MTTRAELRLALRRRLEDSTAAPLWDDDSLNDALAAALHAYGTRLPREQSATIEIAPDATSIPITTPELTGLSPDRIVQVFDERGEPVPRGASWQNGRDRDGISRSTPFAQSWRWWDSTLYLEYALPVPVTWRIDYLGDRALPADDVTAVAIVPGDDEIVLLLATAAALERRLVADGKRGGTGRDGQILSGLATHSRQRADLLLDRRLRRVRSSQ